MQRYSLADCSRYRTIIDTNLSKNDLYNSRNLTAINIDGASVVTANLFAPFAKVSISQAGGVNSQYIYGQKIAVSGSSVVTISP